MRRSLPTPHTTDQELKFIDSIGRNSVEAIEGRISRRELLSKYLTAARQRIHWDMLDKYEVINYVKESIARS